MKSHFEYGWMFLVFVFALNLFGVGNDFQPEFQMIWVLLSLIGWTISSKFASSEASE